MHTRTDLLRLFAGRLRALHVMAGKPTLAAMDRMADILKRSTISDVLNARSAPTLDFVVAFVEACRRHAEGAGLTIEEDLADEGRWREHWMILQRDLGQVRRGPDGYTAANADERLAPAKPGTLLLIDGVPPLVGDVTDPRLLGVHRAASESDVDDGWLPPYVQRDVDSRLWRGLTRPGFYVLVGDSTAGKTRTAYEAMRRVLPNHLLIAPQDRESVIEAVRQAALSPRSVLWLDDLELFLGANGLTRAKIGQLLIPIDQHHIILATMRAVEAARYAHPPTDPSMHAIRPAVDALAQAHRFHIARLLSDPEKNRVRRVARDDSRMSSALSHLDGYGLAEYLAAGPRLLDEWKLGGAAGMNPRGAALVDAAVDCRRAGMLRPLPRDLLVTVSDTYLAAAGGSRLDPESPEEAWRWATQTRVGTAALLAMTAEDAFLPFDYLVDVTDRDSRPDHYPPDSTLLAAIAHADPPEALRLGAGAFDHGRFGAAAAAYQHAFKIQQQQLGEQNPATLDSRDRHAFVLRRLGAVREAAAEHRAVLEIRTTILGPDHLDTLTSRNNLAAALYQAGEWVDAEREFRIVLQRRRVILGPDDPQTLRSYSNHATVLYNLGRWHEALTATQLALSGRMRLLGAAHPHTLISRNNHGLILHAAGRLAEALDEHTIAFEQRVHLLGEEHPDTLESRHNRASVLYSLGRHGESEAEHRAVLEARIRRLGPHHPDTIDAAVQHTMDLCVLGQIAQAQQLARDTVAAAAEHLGDDHPYTLDATDALGATLTAAEGFAEALELHRDTLARRTRLLGPSHPYTLRSEFHLAAALLAGGQVVVASDLLRRVFDAQRSTLGESHPDTLATAELMHRASTDS